MLDVAGGKVDGQGWRLLPSQESRTAFSVVAWSVQVKMQPDGPGNLSYSKPAQTTLCFEPDAGIFLSAMLLLSLFLSCV